MQGKGLRDQAQEYETLGCEILGISFDAPAENKAFREKYDFPFRLLSDPERTVGIAYHAARPDAADGEGDRPVWARRISYLIAPDGTIARTYKVGDVNAHAAEVLADLRELQGRS